MTLNSINPPCFSKVNRHSNVELADVPDVRKYLASLDENPVETYYVKAKSVHDKINKKASMFGVLNKNEKRDSR